MSLSLIRILNFNTPLIIKNGLKIKNYMLMYKTYGKLNKSCSNAILVCHALNASCNLFGFNKKVNEIGWWDNMIGPNKALDTNIFFIIIINNIGSCFGSTGPNHINYENNKIYGLSFPILTIEDWVNIQANLADKLCIFKFAAIIGGSLGGMQALAWSIMYPDRLNYCIIIASAIKLSAKNIAFNDITRQIILSDPFYQNNNFFFNNNLNISRMIGHVTYLSNLIFKKKFNRNFSENNISYKYTDEFQIESYLRNKGEKFSNFFDSNSYLLITKALDYFNIPKSFGGNFEKSFINNKVKYLILSFKTDLRFNIEHNIEIIKSIINNKNKIYFSQLESIYGHDSFLLNNFYYINIINLIFKKISKNIFY